MSQKVVFHAVLSKHLEMRNWTQRRFAAEGGVSQPFLARVLQGQRRPPLELMAKWIAMLNVSSREASELSELALAEHGAEGLVPYLKG